ncbi:YG31B protein, partial [Melanocharis versteri]|nr:YG31B protein [Melanocharis versteri]
LKQSVTPKRVQIIQYMDDLLIAGEKEEEVKKATIELLNFLGRKGLKVSKRKLQFAKREVWYLGHLIGKGYKKLSNERIEVILSLPSPKTKRDVQKLL